MTQTFSIEAVVLGRNDNYEPNWLAKLYASIAYNRALFEGSNVDFRVVFVEWNPPPENPLISPDLVKAFDYVRAIVVDADVHDRLCTADNLAMMLNFPINAALRTSVCDYQIITGGDIFLGHDLAERIKAHGLNPNCLYRAERVNIRSDIDFTTATRETLEDANAIVTVNSCSIPPYDKPPFTHACGDFLMADRLTMNGLRGFDEAISFARLHLDSRFAHNAMAAGLDCELLGQIFHINHTNSFINRQDNYPGKPYDYNADLPYINSKDWGMKGFSWTEQAARLWKVSIPVVNQALDGLLKSEVAGADVVTRTLAEVKSLKQPAQPLTGAAYEVTRLDPALIRAEAHWPGSSVSSETGAVTVTTVESQWGYSAYLPLAEVEPDADMWNWMELDVEGLEGQVGIAALQKDDLTDEKYVLANMAKQTVFIPLKPGVEGIMFRNTRAGGASRLAVADVKVIKQKRQAPDFDHLLLQKA